MLPVKVLLSWLWAPAALLSALQLWRRSLLLLHMLQLEGYRTGRLVRWLRLHPRTALAPPEVWAKLPLVFLPPLLAGPLWLAEGLWWRARARPYRPKRPLRFTARARRLLVSWGLLAALSCAAMWTALPLPLARRALATALGVMAGCPILLIAANLCNWPVEEAVRRRYLRDARRRLEAWGGTVVAITGSYGKTTTKEMLATLLERRYSVCRTPESYNTPMGLCRVVRERLRPQHEVLVVEMGAYGPGEIRQLCRLVRPRIGVITVVGHQHLERFRTPEAIARTKYELVEELPPGGVAVFNQDDPVSRRLADRTRRVRVVRYGLAPEAEVRAEGVSLGPDGLRFRIAHGGRSAEVHLRLLGRHNVHNFLAAAAVALELGMGLEEIAAAAERVQPVPHRLQLLPGRVTVIDDAYNANPQGAREALEVLRCLRGGRRVLVTPGLVELGRLEAEENRRLGRLAAACCDQVVLVGPRRTRPILEGLREGGFPAERIAVVEDLEGARCFLQRFLREGDVVLFENDLPDTYSEAWR